MKFLSNKNIKQNIIIGTAQLGENYGISNKNIDYEIKSRIEFLDFCYQNGFHSFDTAYTYKNSHKIIGKNFSIITFKWLVLHVVNHSKF